MEEKKRRQNNGGYTKMLRANNLKQSQVAAFTGLSANTISNYGRDIRGIRIGHLQDIANFLRVDVQKIIVQMLYFDKDDAKKKKK
jgi:transcriptional regulator with XRE-family HTH domain